MTLAELLLIAVGLSMDAFAVAVCTGLTMKKISAKKPLVVGLYFGFFQAAMPLIGFLVATLFADMITSYDHWLAFVLLCFLGVRMIIESLKKEGVGCTDRDCPAGICQDRSCPGGQKPESKEITMSPRDMLPMALATSIDALAAGVSFAFLKVDIVPAVSFIGVTTLVLSFAGVIIGSVFGAKFKSKAEFAGGCILILMGVKILLEHVNIISF